jgi:hypothetical protein
MLAKNTEVVIRDVFFLCNLTLGWLSSKAATDSLVSQPSKQQVDYLLVAAV